MASAEIGVDGEGVEAAGAGAGSVAVEQSDGPAGNGSIDAGIRYAGVGVGEQGADLAAVEAFAGMAVATGFEIEQRLAVPMQGVARRKADRGFHPGESGEGGARLGGCRAGREAEEAGGADGLDAVAGAAALEEVVFFDHRETEGGEDELFAGGGVGEDDIAFLEDAVALEGGGDAAHGFVGDGGDAGADGDFAAEGAAGLLKGFAKGGNEASEGDIQFAERMEVGGDDFVDGAVIGAEEALAGEPGGAEAFFEGFVLGRFFHQFIPILDRINMIFQDSQDWTAKMNGH